MKDVGIGLSAATRRAGGGGGGGLVIEDGNDLAAALPGSPVLVVASDVGVTKVSTKVSQWDDLSGNSNHLVQGTDSSRPFEAGHDLPLPREQFRADFVGEGWDLTSNIVLNNRDCSIVVAVRLWGTDSWNQSLSLSDGTNTWEPLRYQAVDTFRSRFSAVYDSTLTAAAGSSNVVEMYRWEDGGGNLEFVVNGASDGVQSVSEGSTNRTMTGFTQEGNVLIAGAMAVWDSGISDAGDRATVREAFRQWAGITF